MSSLGEAFIDVHADTHALGPEIEAGAKKAADESEARNDFDGFVKAADKAGTRAGDEFGKSFVRDASGRLHDEKGRFVSEADKVGKEAGDKMANSLGDSLEKKTRGRVSSLGKLIAPAWTRTIATWIAAIAPGAIELVGTLAPAVGVLAAIVPAAIGGAAALTVLRFAFGGLSKIMKDSTTNVALFNQELAKLGPSTQQFIKTLVALKPVFADFKKEIQNSFFAGFNANVSFGRLHNALQLLRGDFTGLSHVLGDQFGKVIAHLTSNESLGSLKTILEAFSQTMQNLAPVLNHVLDIFLTLGKAASPLLDSLFTSLAKVTGQFAAFLDQANGNGKLSKFFDQAQGAFSQLLSLATDLSSILFDIFSAGAKAGGGGTLLVFIHTLAKAVDELNKNGTLTAFFKAFNQVASALFSILTPLLPVIGKLASVLGDSLLKIIQAITPPLILISQSIADALIPVLPALGQAIDSLAPVLADLGATLADLFKQITPDLASLLVNLFIGLAQTFIDLEPSLKIILPALEELTVVLVKLLTAQTIALLQAFILALPLLADALLVTISPLLLFAKLMQGVIYLLDTYVLPFVENIPTELDQGGKVLAAVFTQLGDWFGKLGTKIADFFTKTIPKYWDMFIKWLESLPDKAAALFGRIFRAARDAVFVEIGVIIGLVLAAFTKLPGKIIDALSGMGEKVAHYLAGQWDKGIVATEAFVDSAWKIIQGLPGKIGSALSGLGHQIAKIFSDAWQTAVDKVSTAIANIITYVRNLPGKLVALGGRLLSAGATLITQFLSGLAHPGKIVNSISDTVFGFLKEKLNYVIGKINEGINSVGKYVGGLPNIPKLAKGAFITHPTLALIGESGPEVVIPTQDPERARTLLNESGLARSLDFHSSAPRVLVTVMIGDQELNEIVDTRVAVANDSTSRQLTYGARTV